MTENSVKKLAELVKAAKDALLEAQKFADQHALSFTWNDSYGSFGQTYIGRGAKDTAWNFEDSSERGEWSASDEDHTEGGYLKEGKWVSSSDDC